MWSIQILWADVWITVQRGFKDRDAAEWAIGKWKQANECHGDPFRAYEEIPYALDLDVGKITGLVQNHFDQDAWDKEMAHDQRAEDEAAYQRELRDQLIDQRR